MTVGELATGDVVTAEPTDTLRDAAKRMDAAGVGSVVVLDDGALVGILTERDLLRSVAASEAPDTTPVQQRMTSPVVTVGPDWEVYEAAAEMGDHRIRHLVVTEDGRVVGILSVRDVLLAGQRVPLTGGGWVVLRDPLTFTVRERRRLQKCLLSVEPGPTDQIGVDELIPLIVGAWSLAVAVPAGTAGLSALAAADLDLLRAAVRDELPHLQRSVQPAPGWRRWD